MVAVAAAAVTTGKDRRSRTALGLSRTSPRCYASARRRLADGFRGAMGSQGASSTGAGKLG
jgi:hypothetical protein